MVEISQKIKEPKAAMKVLKGHPIFFFLKSDFVFLCFKIEVGFCEHLALSFRKSEFAFRN